MISSTAGRFLAFLKKDIMLAVAVLAAIISCFITAPSRATFQAIDWKTLATLFMLLLILDGFKSENLFLPVIRLTGGMHSQLLLSLFLVFGVFFSSMFVTNDVSLIIFVPLTILLFRGGGKERYLLPVLVLENTAAIRGSLLTPFGSPQNLFLFSQSGIAVGDFLRMMLPLWVGSAVLLVGFIAFIYRRNLRESFAISRSVSGTWEPKRRTQRIVYLALFCLCIATIVSRTRLWPAVLAIVTITLLIFDRRVFQRVDYALIGTFFCFFLFSSSVAANDGIASFLSRAVAGHEYVWSIALSQLISNVPGAIVLWPFTAALKPLIYGLDTAGLVTVIGSLASVICLRIYAKEYPGHGGKFLAVFELYSLAFFAIVAPLQLLLLK